MNAKEFRSGNWMQGHPISIPRMGISGDGTTALTAYGIHLIEDGILNGLSPIPIDEKWLIKLGFKKRHEEGSVWMKEIEQTTFLLNSTASEDNLPYHASLERNIVDGFSIQQAAFIQNEVNDMNDESFILEHHHMYLKRIFFIHQLQNLYFEIFDEELINQHTP